jgi:hypothetical protein
MLGPERASWVRRSSSFELWWDYSDRTPVLALFVLVWSLLIRDSRSCTEGNKEQILATVVPTMVVRRLVCIPVGPLSPCDPVSIFE